jgi:hypothetical protein
MLRNNQTPVVLTDGTVGLDVLIDALDNASSVNIKAIVLSDLKQIALAVGNRGEIVGGVVRDLIIQGIDTDDIDILMNDPSDVKSILDKLSTKNFAYEHIVEAECLPITRTRYIIKIRRDSYEYKYTIHFLPFRGIYPVFDVDAITWDGTSLKVRGQYDLKTVLTSIKNKTTFYNGLASRSRIDHMIKLGYTIKVNAHHIVHHGNLNDEVVENVAHIVQTHFNNVEKKVTPSVFNSPVIQAFKTFVLSDIKRYLTIMAGSDPAGVIIKELTNGTIFQDWLRRAIREKYPQASPIEAEGIATLCEDPQMSHLIDPIRDDFSTAIREAIDHI